VNHLADAVDHFGQAVGQGLGLRALTKARAGGKADGILRIARPEASSRPMVSVEKGIQFLPWSRPAGAR